MARKRGGWEYPKADDGSWCLHGYRINAAELMRGAIQVSRWNLYKKINCCTSLTHLWLLLFLFFLGYGTDTLKSDHFSHANGFSEFLGEGRGYTPAQ